MLAQSFAVAYSKWSHGITATTPNLSFIHVTTCMSFAWRRVSYYWKRAVLPSFSGFVSGSTITWMIIDGKYQAIHTPLPARQRLV